MSGEDYDFCLAGPDKRLIFQSLNQMVEEAEEEAAETVVEEGGGKANGGLGGKAMDV